MVRQPQEIQTLYAELSERLAAYEAARSFSTLKGGFAKKRVSGADYWYFKTSEMPSGQREYSVGPDTPATRSVIGAYQKGRAEVEAIESAIDRLCAMLRQGGAMTTDTVSAKVISGLGSAGVFRLGAMLVGTHAFIALGNMLGVRWQSGIRTEDIDVLASPVLEVAVGDVAADLPATLESLNIGFLPVPRLNRRQPETSFKVRGKTLRVDLLTPGRRNAAPVLIPRLKAAAQPLEFLGYLLEAPVATPVINGGATLVNVPDPARFALLKLMVSMVRHVSSQTKAGKDRQQAGEMIEVLIQDRPGDLELAVESINKRPAAWRRQLRAGLDRLPADLAGAKRRIAGLLVS
ncbi:MAG TPA: GSU2403 family nucleotidyltransferase fold protein [Burkholderiales bacterium]|jgi:hypothetical protein|nr:GSU2403 family nucleotidyltransferase fold protein [Burkholderiales bacterium]